MATIVPALQPRVPQQGLLAVLPVLPGGFPSRDSIEFAPELCSGFGGVQSVDCDDDINLSEDAVNPGLVADGVWWVWQADECSTAALEGEGRRDFTGRAQRALLATQSYWVARALWTGEFNGSGPEARSLASVEAEEVDGSPLSVVNAIAALEAALASCGKGRLGLIHMTAGLLSVAATTTQLRFTGGAYLTPMGHRVVADAGYDGSGPAGGSGDGETQWMYGTSDMAYALSEIETTPGSLAEATTPRTNRVRVQASRFAVVQWDECCHFSAEVAVPWLEP